MTRSVNLRAMATVSSVLSLSTTTISSAHESDSRAAVMLADSLKVMTVAVTGTATSLTCLGCVRCERCLLPEKWRCLDGGEVHHRLGILDQREQLAVTRDVEIALRLEHEEAAGHAGLILLLLRFETLLGQGPRRPRRVDAL